MYQNFVSTVIRELNAGDLAVTTTNIRQGGVKSNRACFKLESNTTGLGAQLLFDAADNSVVTFDISKVAELTGNESFVAYTYVASAPATGHTLTMLPHVLLDTNFQVALGTPNVGILSTKGSFVCPKLDTALGESQYVAICIVGNSGDLIGSLSAYMRVHVRDVASFQPSK